MTVPPSSSFEWPKGDARLLLIFNGHCGICTRLADWVQRHDQDLRVLVIPSQTPGLLQAVGLTKAEVDREAWAVDRKGRRYGGAAAINRTLSEIGGRWELAARAYQLVGMQQIEDAGYSWFARNRGRFSRWGVTPACERPEVICGQEHVSAT